MITQQLLDDLERVKQQLGTEAQTLEDLWQSRPLLWQALGWSQVQLKLWLRCLKGIEEAEGGNEVQYSLPTSASPESDLSVEIAQIVKAHGKPMPLAQIKNKLPTGRIATEEMIKAAIDKHPNLKIQGPMVRASN
tara:strand:+ start:519 stop:923 length:405 start_codon:yes stop_codon:yes gene_type:complete